MGAWGIGLYANDLSSDMKAAFKDVVRLPCSETELVEVMLDAFPAGRDSDDPEYPDFWLTLADLFHAYGIASPDVFKRARGLIASGDDLENKRSLDMSASDLGKREKLLAGLVSKWDHANAKPLTRKILKEPEPLLFETCDCVVIPTQAGNGAPGNERSAKTPQQFAPDGWGAFVVLTTAHRYGYWACYLIGRLHLRTQDKPTLKDFKGACFSGLRNWLPGVPKDVAIKTVTISNAEAKKMKLETIGRLDLDQNVLGAEFADRFALAADPYWSIRGLLRPYSDAGWFFSERPVEMKKLPLTRFVA